MKEKGFTMLELLLAAAILGFALTGMLALYTNCIFLNQSNRLLIIASSHAQYLMEGLKSQTSIVDLRAKIDSGYADLKPSMELSNENLTACCCDTSNNCYVTCPTQDPQRVCVTDTWKERGTRDRSVSLQTLFTYQ